MAGNGADRNNAMAFNRNILLPALLAGMTVGLADSPPVPAPAPPSAADLRATIRKQEPLHTRLPKPQPGDWLARFPEPGQTFEAWLASNPRTALGARRILYIQPIGDFSKDERRIVDLTTDFMGRTFNLKTRTLDPLPLNAIPAQARREHPTWHDKQILSTYVLNRVLKPALPKDAAVLIAFTASDLWPGEGWNFVFGQASIEDRVGVWSLYRMGDTNGQDAFKLALLRTLKIATHETGHMFGMLHCTAWECNLCGCNSREEADRHPLWCCPECMPKICMATGAEPIARYRSLSVFCSTNGLKAEAAFYLKSADILGK